MKNTAVIYIRNEMCIMPTCKVNAEGIIYEDDPVRIFSAQDTTSIAKCIYRSIDGDMEETVRNLFADPPASILSATGIKRWGDFYRGTTRYSFDNQGSEIEVAIMRNMNNRHRENYEPHIIYIIPKDVHFIEMIAKHIFKTC